MNWYKLRRWYRLKHYWKYDEDGNPHRWIDWRELDDAVQKFEIAQRVLDNIFPDMPDILFKDINVHY